MGGAEQSATQREWQANEHNIQVSTVVPHWIGQIPAHRINEDLVLVELEDDVGQPPVPLPLQTLAIAGRAPPCGVWRRLECFLDDFWDLHARC